MTPKGPAIYRWMNAACVAYPLHAFAAGKPEAKVGGLARQLQRNKLSPSGWHASRFLFTGSFSASSQRQTPPGHGQATAFGMVAVCTALIWLCCGGAAAWQMNDGAKQRQTRKARGCRIWHGLLRDEL